MFARLANGNEGPVRVIEGQGTKLSRTMHGIAYDSVHDEIIVPVHLAGAVLVFRAGATGEEAPIRIIQGPHTRILRPETAILMRRMMEQVEDGLRGGEKLSDCFDRHPKIFPEFYRAVVRSAELSGQLGARVIGASLARSVLERDPGNEKAQRLLQELEQDAAVPGKGP